MQVLKDEIRQRINNAAKTEFLDNGFNKTSMSQIADRAGVGTSSIYNYYKSKDELFIAVTTNVKRAVENLLSARINNGEKTELPSDEKRNRIEDFIVRFLYSNRIELLLLFCRAEGSTLENYKSDFLDSFYAQGEILRDRVRMENPEYRFSKDLMQGIGEMMISMFAGLLERKVAENILRDRLRELNGFMMYGSQGLIEGRWKIDSPT